MPQPLPVGKTVTTGPNYILRRAELAAHAANVCANFTLIEKCMVDIYSLVLGETMPFKPLAVRGPMVHPVGIQIFDSLNSLGARMDLLTKLLSWYAAPKIFADFRDNIALQIFKRFAERSTIAHGNWGVCDDYPDALILLPAFGSQQIWKKRDFEAVSSRILSVNKSLTEIVGQVLHHHVRRRSD